jgi:flavorubredoxin
MEKVTEQIINVGVNDYETTLFESQYELEAGMAYNSYLILDEKVALMDTVDASVEEKWLANLDEALGGREIDYLVIDHMEPDHSAGVGKLLRRFPQMKLVGNTKTFTFLGQFIDDDFAERKVVVAEGDTLSLGSHTLTFMMAPMVHWPETMVSYESSEKVLFSADAFGKFGTTDADEAWTCEARRYYFNICGKYGAQVQALLKKAQTLDIEKICSLHGPVLTENLEYNIGKYDIWSKYEPEDRGIFIAYASIHGNTKKAALRLKEMLEEKGEQTVNLTDLCREDIHEAVEDAFRYDTLVLAASSYDGGVFPPMEDFLSHLKSKNYQKRSIAFIENGTWGPTAGRTMKAMTEGLKEMNVIDPMVTIKSTLNDASRAQMEALAQALVER